MKIHSTAENSSDKQTLNQTDLGHIKLKTFSPIDAAINNRLNSAKEVSRDDMMANDIAFKKLFANILAGCKPDALNDEDLKQFSGINGRKVQAGL